MSTCLIDTYIVYSHVTWLQFYLFWNSLKCCCLIFGINLNGWHKLRDFLLKSQIKDSMVMLMLFPAAFFLQYIICI